VFGVAFCLGASSILFGNWLESLAEGRALSSFPFKSAAIDQCAWIAPCVVLTGLALLTVFVLTVCGKSSDSKWGPLRRWAIALAGFVVGLIAGGVFMPTR
jgi:hypothetical protein